MSVCLLTGLCYVIHNFTTNLTCEYPTLAESLEIRRNSNLTKTFPIKETLNDNHFLWIGIDKFITKIGVFAVKRDLEQLVCVTRPIECDDTFYWILSLFLIGLVFCLSIGWLAQYYINIRQSTVTIHENDNVVTNTL